MSSDTSSEYSTINTDDNFEDSFTTKVIEVKKSASNKAEEISAVKGEVYETILEENVTGKEKDIDLNDKSNKNKNENKYKYKNSDAIKKCLDFINERTGRNFKALKELSDGSPFVIILNQVFPNTVLKLQLLSTSTPSPKDTDEEKIKVNESNIGLISNAFDLLGVDEKFDYSKLALGDERAHIDFITWFKKFIESYEAVLKVRSLR